MLAVGDRTHLHNIWSRNIFPFNMEGCVLYAPLWQEDMQGVTLLSYDQYHRSCTVTETTWGIQGRTFDGANDGIISTTNIPLAGYRSVLAWVNLISRPAVNPDLLFGEGTAGGGNSAFLGFDTDGTLTIDIWGNVTKNSTVVVPLSTWTFVGFVYKSATPAKFYVDGVEEAVAGNIGALVDTNSPIEIGDDSLGASVEDLNAVLGEILVYSNSALSAAEIQNIYQVTKWRYQ